MRRFRYLQSTYPKVAMLKGSIAFSSLLCREVQEETGIAVKTSSRVGVYSNPTVDVAHIAKLQEAVEPHAGQMQRALTGRAIGREPSAFDRAEILADAQKPAVNGSKRLPTQPNHLPGLRGAATIESPVAMDEVFELFDNELLITDNAFHHVANRNYTN